MRSAVEINKYNTIQHDDGGCFAGDASDDDDIL